MSTSKELLRETLKVLTSRHQEVERLLYGGNECRHGERTASRWNITLDIPTALIVLLIVLCVIFFDFPVR